MRSLAIWGTGACVLMVPFALATQSPLLQWRDAPYVVAGFAGILAMTVMVFQPLLAAAELPGLLRQRARRVHRWVGLLVLTLVGVHVAGLWLTSPPDVIDALLFRSPTPFSVWGVLAMWALVLSAGLAAMGPPMRPRLWRILHTALFLVIMVGSVVHALLIEGTMETVSKSVLCTVLIWVTVGAVLRRRVWVVLLRRQR
ncbi:ferric reductase-like transmembrane domain-containing protein [Shimia sp. W99]